MNAYAFVSYERGDRAYVRALAAYLKQHDIAIEYDESLVAGDDFTDHICDLIDRCSALIVIMTPDAERSKWVSREIIRGEDVGRPIVPMLLRGEKWYKLGELHYEDVRDGRMPSSEFVLNLQRLVRADPPSVDAESADEDDEYDVERSEAMRQVRNLVSGLIVDFDKKFPEGLRDGIIQQARAEKIFALRTVRALVFGRTHVGKTTTVNKMLGAPVFPITGELTCTRSLAAGAHRSGLIFYDTPGLGDEPVQHNITSAVLGMGQTAGELGDRVDEIRLIDLTGSPDNGPGTRSELSIEDFGGEIDPDFYAAHSGMVAFRSFPAVEFATWIHDNVDFFLFVLGGGVGLYKEDVSVIDAVTRTFGADRVFKVYNVWDDRFQGDVATLSDVRVRMLEQAKDRLRRAGVAGAEDWAVVDSVTSVGLDGLVQSLSQRLPVDVLRGLQPAVDAHFAHHIDARLDASYLDFLCSVAAIAAVFKVDYQYQGADLLGESLGSLVAVGEYLYSRSTGVSARLLDSLVSDLRRARSHKVEKEYDTTKEVSAPGKFIALVERSFDVKLPSMYQTRTVNETRSYKEKKYLHGGVPAVAAVLAIGLALRALYLGAATAADSNSFALLLAEKRDTISRAMASAEGQTLAALLAHKPPKGKHNKTQFANGRVYEAVSKLLARMEIDRPQAR